MAPGTPGFVEASSPQSNVPPVRVNVTFGQPTSSASILITSPAPNAVLAQQFVVQGTATGVQQGSVVVQAFSNGLLLNQTSTTVPGGSGLWSVVLTVNAAPGTSGEIVAFWSQNSAASARVFVSYSGAAP